jgi:hypothetical protein
MGEPNIYSERQKKADFGDLVSSELNVEDSRAVIAESSDVAISQKDCFTSFAMTPLTFTYISRPR